MSSNSLNQKVSYFIKANAKFLIMRCDLMPSRLPAMIAVVAKVMEHSVTSAEVLTCVTCFIMYMHNDACMIM